MLLQAERELIVAYGKKVIRNKLTTGTGGNLSLFNREKQLLAISPSGMHYEDIEPADVVVTNLDGEVVDGKRVPSSELGMHRIYYLQRADVEAVIHTHSTYSTILSTLGWDLPAANYYIAIGGGKDIKCADYASYGTWELAENSLKAMEGRYACLLANHGLLAIAHTLPQAYGIIEETERMAEVYYKAKCVGEPVLLTDEEVALMVEKFTTYGQR